jgi:hypothetical protein
VISKSIVAALSIMAVAAGIGGPAGWCADAPARIVDPAAEKHYVDGFNKADPNEKPVNLIPNAESWNWMVENVPLLDCPDKGIEEMYYFRWWSLRKHIKHIKASQYICLTEFLQWENPVSSAVGHHVMEGRWIHDNKIFDQDLLYWLRGDTGKPFDQHRFSSWTIWAAYQRYLVNGDKQFIVGMLDDFVRDYSWWEKDHLAPNGLYWQKESADAMEESINGSRQAEFRRPTISSYMYGNALAIAQVAKLAGKPEMASTYEAKAASIKKAVQEILWDPQAQFFKQQWPDGYLGSFREEIGYVPWYFELPDKNKGYEAAWAQLKDPEGFLAPFGITTAERRAPGFRTHGSGHGCEWDGAVWPFSTSHTLSAMANLLDDYPQNVVTKEDYLQQLQTYAKAQHLNGRPYIGEYQDETTGRWLRDDLERGRSYNHSTFCDLVINGLIGIRPHADDVVEVSPLVPEGKWDYFCLDNVLYHGQTLAIVWDKTGQKYGKGAGLTILANGKPIAHAAELTRITVTLPK